LYIKVYTRFTIFLSAAWVHRGFRDDVTEVNTVQPGADLITDFQKDKFRHFFFHVLDLNSDCVISAEDFEKLNEVNSCNWMNLTNDDAIRVALKKWLHMATSGQRVVFSPG